MKRTVPSNEPSHERKKGDDCDYFFRSKKNPPPLWKCLLFCVVVVADVISSRCFAAFTEHGFKNGGGRQPRSDDLYPVFVKKRYGNLHDTLLYVT